MSDLQKAKTLLESGGYTCVILRESTAYYGVKRGIAPLLEFIESGIDFTGFSAADKIVGKAAAFLYVKMNLTAVYGEVLSVSAAEILKKNGVEYGYGTLTEKIINRAGDGICPMEKAVANADDPGQAVDILKRALQSIRENKI